LNQYLDNNNFVTYNHVISRGKGSLFGLIESPHELEFLNFKPKQYWRGESVIDRELVFNNGMMQIEEIEYIFGIYFFVDNKMKVHTITGFGILDLLSRLGGLFKCVLGFFSVIGGFYNTRTLLGHLISKTYFIRHKHCTG